MTIEEFAKSLKADRKDEIEKTSVLNTRRVDAMMLPFRTSVMMRVQ